MSYTYLQGQEEVSSEVYCWDTDPCALLKSKNIQGKSCCNGNGTESCQDSQSGMMSQHLTGSRGEEKLMSCAVGFLAKTLARQEKAQVLREKDRVCGGKWRELYLKCLPDLYSLRTVRCLFQEDLELSSVTFPDWGMMQDGELLERVTSAGAINGTGFGSLPTPRASDSEGGAVKNVTNSTGSWSRVNRKGVRFGVKLRDALWAIFGCERSHPKTHEMVMGWPAGWTDLKPLGTDRCRPWLQLHGGFFMENKEINAVASGREANRPFAEPDCCREGSE